LYDGMWDNVGTVAQLTALDERLRLGTAQS